MGCSGLKAAIRKKVYYAKVFLPKAYIVIHKFDIICISEIYLDSSTPSDDSDLEISGYALVNALGHPANKKERVFVFITEAFYLYKLSMSKNYQFLSLSIPKPKSRRL